MYSTLFDKESKSPLIQVIFTIYVPFGHSHLALFIVCVHMPTYGFAPTEHPSSFTAILAILLLSVNILVSVYPQNSAFAPRKLYK